MFPLTNTLIPKGFAIKSTAPDSILLDILVGLIKGVGIYYKEDLKVKKWGDKKVEVIFPG